MATWQQLIGEENRHIAEGEWTLTQGPARTYLFRAYLRQRNTKKEDNFLHSETKFNVFHIFALTVRLGNTFQLVFLLDCIGIWRSLKVNKQLAYWTKYLLKKGVNLLSRAYVISNCGQVKGIRKNLNEWIGVKLVIHRTVQNVL